MQHSGAGHGTASSTGSQDPLPLGRDRHRGPRDPAGTQRRMAERANATITEVAGSHVSMVSHPQVSIDAILPPPPPATRLRPSSTPGRVRSAEQPSRASPLPALRVVRIANSRVIDPTRPMAVGRAESVPLAAPSGAGRPLVGEMRPDVEAGPVVRAMASVARQS